MPDPSLASSAVAGARGSQSTAADADPSSADQPVDRGGCTVVYAAGGGVAVGGNNEDERNPLTRIWFVPAERGGHGSAFVGYDDLVIQGGINDAGLFFDGLAVRNVEVPANPGKPVFTGQNFFVEAMSTCDSVGCVLDKLRAVSMPGTWNGQTLFGDRFGRSAIIEPLTVIPKDGAFQVATNFFQSEVPPADRTDGRYLTATRMLAAAGGASPDLVRDVLDATHQEGTVNTVYSTVYDLTSQTIDLYYFHDFGAPVTFGLRDELAKGLHGYEMAALFPSNRAAAERAARVGAEVAAARARLPVVPVTTDDLAGLSGVYQAQPVLTLSVEADSDGLRVRQPWTPWVPLVPVGPSEFARVFSDAEELVHEQHLRFGGGAGGASQVEISNEAGQRLVAARVPAAGIVTAAPASLLAVLVVMAAAATLVWRVRRSGWHRPAREARAGQVARSLEPATPGSRRHRRSS